MAVSVPMDFIDRVWELDRALVSDGYDDALDTLAEYVDDDADRAEFTVHEVPSGEPAWTWEVPPKWSVESASIEAEGETLVEYDHPLRVVSYSNPVHERVTADELDAHLHTDRAQTVNGETIPAHPDALPYVFDFYGDDWGFCIRETERDRFEGYDEFDVTIDARFEPGRLKAAEYTVRGEREETVLLSAHLDHPCQVNDDLAGVAVGLAVLNALADRETPTRYTYTLLVCPETIGSLAFLSHNEHRIPDLTYGVYLEMLGTDGQHALQHSYEADTEIDRVATRALEDSGEAFDTGPFRTVIGNDEMVTNGPGVRVPTVSLSRWPFEEYHTSLDTPEIVAESNLADSAETVLTMVRYLERNRTPRATFRGPLFLSGTGLWEKWGGWGASRKQFEYVSMCLDGDHSVLDIAERHDLAFETVADLVADLADRDLVEYATE